MNIVPPVTVDVLDPPVLVSIVGCRGICISRGTERELRLSKAGVAISGCLGDVRIEDACMAVVVGSSGDQIPKSAGHKKWILEPVRPTKNAEESAVIVVIVCW